MLRLRRHLFREEGAFFFGLGQRQGPGRRLHGRVLPGEHGPGLPDEHRRLPEEAGEGREGPAPGPGPGPPAVTASPLKERIGTALEDDFLRRAVAFTVDRLKAGKKGSTE